MKKLLVATAIALTLASAVTPLAQASTKTELTAQKKAENTHELIGFSSGAIAGGAVAGPLGAIIGGLFGVLIADDINGDAQLSIANQNLAKATNNLQQQEQNMQALQLTIETMQRQQMVKLAAFEEQISDSWLNEIDNFETNLQFKTASFLLEDIYVSQLNNLASMLSRYPQLKVNVTGYADVRGDSSYNKVLSEQRAKVVARYLVNNKVNVDQINMSGEGETTHKADANSVDAQQNAANIEDLFFARKVKITLIKPNQQMTAAN